MMSRFPGETRIRLKSAFCLDAGAVYEFLALLPPLRILIQILKLIALRQILNSHFLLNYFFRNFIEFWLKIEAFGLFSEIFYSFAVDFFFYGFAVLQQEIFCFFSILPCQMTTFLVDYRLKAMFRQLIIVFFAFDHLDQLVFLMFAAHPSFVQELPIIRSSLITNASLGRSQRHLAT